jgi:hypothetical protein
MNYQDKWTRWHDKPCTDGEPSSNNGWIYTAYAFHLGLDFKFFELDACFEECRRGEWPKIDRTPGKLYPPLSRDEVIGLYVCGLIYIKQLRRTHWQFCNIPGFEPKPLWKVNWFKAARAAWKIRKAHRNALWEEDDLWHFGFRLPPQDTWFILKVAERKPSFIHTLYFYISSILTITGKSNSGKLILWLKLKELKMEDSPLFTFLEWENAFIEYFGEDHPFTKAL